MTPESGDGRRGAARSPDAPLPRHRAAQIKRTDDILRLDPGERARVLEDDDAARMRAIVS